MTHVPIDPDLIGIWILPGHPQTYEITPDGAYHVADPEEPVRFENGGEVMIWGDRRHIRTVGAGDTPVGTWREDATGDGWDFTEDQAVTILPYDAGDGNAQAYVGIWALRDEGRALWVQERHAILHCDGACLRYEMVTGETLEYGYAVRDGVFQLLERESGVELTRYVAAALFHDVAGTGG